jgi:hypothetical protein
MVNGTQWPLCLKDTRTTAVKGDTVKAHQEATDSLRTVATSESSPAATRSSRSLFVQDIEPGGPRTTEQLDELIPVTVASSKWVTGADISNSSSRSMSRVGLRAVQEPLQVVRVV